MSFMNLDFRYPSREPNAERVSFGCPPYSPWEPPKVIYENRKLPVFQQSAARNPKALFVTAKQAASEMTEAGNYTTLEMLYHFIKVGRLKARYSQGWKIAVADLNWLSMADAPRPPLYSLNQIAHLTSKGQYRVAGILERMGIAPLKLGKLRFYERAVIDPIMPEIASAPRKEGSGRAKCVNKKSRKWAYAGSKKGGE